MFDDAGYPTTPTRVWWQAVKRQFDGISAALVGATAPYRVGFFFTTTPTASEVLLVHVVTDAFTVPIGLSGTRVSVGTNPAASFILSVRKNGVEFGTVTISTGGVATLAAASATSFAAGDLLSVLGPAVADTTIANVAVTLRGTV